MTTYKHILIILDTFEIIFIGALFGPGTAVVGVAVVVTASIRVAVVIVAGAL